ncbi:Hsp20/alpha crystallin family protein [Asticcacaulis sp.]|uniref:Hsp20/alpha crystallin family protein n=1 Tax=Asticcacaulis sp. TaxID=1872648 RepID=UPI002CCCE6E1|nr:Hsp20/alpha crystallin family protein [Asticcacaulis sp.]HTM82829.1 Hsp20/alpha crystallin family protein [Asticcacaulis sp.]
MSNQSLTPSRKEAVAVSRGDNPIRGLQNDVNRLFNEFFGDLAFPAWDRFLGDRFAATFAMKAPAIDLRESDKAYTLVAEVPGMQVKDIQISTSDGCLTLAGERNEEKETHDKGYIRQECSYGSFRRVVPMPADADIDAVKAEMKNGLLTLTIAKKAPDTTKTRKIDIREVA